MKTKPRIASWSILAATCLLTSGSAAAAPSPWAGFPYCTEYGSSCYTSQPIYYTGACLEALVDLAPDDWPDEATCLSEAQVAYLYYWDPRTCPLFLCNFIRYCEDNLGCDRALDDPVCGANGFTFKNECFAECADVPVRAYSSCDDFATCAQSCYPSTAAVCGGTLLTYENACEAACAGVNIIAYQSCESAFGTFDFPACMVACAVERGLEQYAPATAINLQTYPTYCTAQCTNHQIMDCVNDCPYDPDPVCVVPNPDWVFPHACAARCFNFGINYAGRCLD